MYCALLWRDSMVSWGWHRAVKFWQNEKPPGRFFSVILSYMSILYMDQARVSWAYAANKRIIVLREGCDFWPHQVEQLTQSYIIHSVLLYWSQISGTANYSHLCFNNFCLYWQHKENICLKCLLFSLSFLVIANLCSIVFITQQFSGKWYKLKITITWSRWW